MNVLWLSWKDINHPKAGGAEIITDQLLARLASEGHSVTLISSGYDNAKTHEDINGYTVIRGGNRFTVYFVARKLVQNQPTKWDLVIEEVNTVPFFLLNSIKSNKSYLFFHQLAREVWWYEIVFPVSLFGYLLEPLYLRLLRKNKALTISNSTKQDLLRYGFRPENIYIISEGIDMKPVDNLNSIKKFEQPTLLSLGALRSMKRTLDQVKAFELVRKKVHNLKLIIAGPNQSNYGKKVINYVRSSKYSHDITILGRIKTNEKIELMRRCHVILVTSVKEGWGLIVTEANSQGTPAVAYNVDGLRDSVKDGETGLLSVQNNPEALSLKIMEVIGNKNVYEEMRQKGWEWSCNITFEQCYNDFMRVVND